MTTIQIEAFFQYPIIQNHIGKQIKYIKYLIKYDFISFTTFSFNYN